MDARRSPARLAALQPAQVHLAAVDSRLKCAVVLLSGNPIVHGRRDRQEQGFSPARSPSPAGSARKSTRVVARGSMSSGTWNRVDLRAIADRRSLVRHFGAARSSGVDRHSADLRRRGTRSSSLALAWAEAPGARDIVIGVTRSTIPAIDCRRVHPRSDARRARDAGASGAGLCRRRRSLSKADHPSRLVPRSISASHSRYDPMPRRAVRTMRQCVLCQGVP